MEDNLKRKTKTSDITTKGLEQQKKIVSVFLEEKVDSETMDIIMSSMEISFLEGRLYEIRQNKQ